MVAPIEPIERVMPTTEGQGSGREKFEKDDDGRESDEQAEEMRVQLARSNERNYEES